MPNTSASNYPMHTASGVTAIIAVSGGRILGVNPADPIDLPAWTSLGASSTPVPLPAWTASGDGTAGEIGSSDAFVDPSLYFIVAAGSGVTSSGAATVSSSFVMRPWRARGEARTGRNGTSAEVMPMFRASGAARTDQIGVSAVTLPMFLAAGTAIASGAASYESLALNAKRSGMTFIDGWAFNSMGILNGLRIALTDDALVQIDGDTDDGEPIAATIKTHVADLGTTRRKRGPSMLVGYRCDGDMELTVIVNEHQEHIYVLEAPGHEELGTGRVKIGRGLDGRYWQLQLTNVDGCDFELDDIRVDMTELSRSVP